MLRYTATPPAPSQGAPSHTRPERPKPSRAYLLSELAKTERELRTTHAAAQQLREALATTC